MGHSPDCAFTKHVTTTRLPQGKTNRFSFTPRLVPSPFVQTRCMLTFEHWLTSLCVASLCLCPNVECGVCVCLFVGNGTVRLGSHSAQRTTSAFPARRYNTRQDHGGQSIMGWRENCHYYLQVCHVIQASF